MSFNKFGTCASGTCRHIEFKAVTCIVDLHWFHDPAQWHQLNEDKDWTYEGHYQPYGGVVRQQWTGSWPDLYLVYHEYYKDPITGVITSGSGAPGWDGWTQVENSMWGLAPFDRGTALAQSEVDAYDFDDMDWNTGIHIHWNYGTRSVSTGSTAGSNVFGSSLLRKGQARKLYGSIFKFQVRVDGAHCKYRQDLTDDVRPPNWNGTGNAGYQFSAETQLGECGKQKIVTAEVPDWWGYRIVTVESCGTCNTGSSDMISHAVCFPAP